MPSLSAQYGEGSLGALAVRRSGEYETPDWTCGARHRTSCKPVLLAKVLEWPPAPFPRRHTEPGSRVLLRRGAFACVPLLNYSPRRRPFSQLLIDAHGNNLSCKTWQGQHSAPTPRLEY